MIISAAQAWMGELGDYQAQCEAFEVGQDSTDSDLEIAADMMRRSAASDGIEDLDGALAALHDLRAWARTHWDDGDTAHERHAWARAPDDD